MDFFFFFTGVPKKLRQDFRILKNCFFFHYSEIIYVYMYIYIYIYIYIIIDIMSFDTGILELVIHIFNFAKSLCKIGEGRRKEE